MVSVGRLIRNHDGAWDSTFITKIGTTSSFIAELWGLREGLALVKSCIINKIITETDFEDILNAVKSEEGSKLEVATLIHDCKLILDQIQDWDLIHTLREGNICADFLANMG